MTAPIRDAQGHVIGAFAGVINLGIPNFLTKIAENKYGRTGTYIIAVRPSRLIVTATDKSSIMTTLPPPGVIPLMDRFIDGYEGSAVYVNPLGVESLVSVKGIPIAGWNMVALLPTEEAFAPIREVQQHMLLVTIFLTLLAGGLAWWMLSRQLAPMLAAAMTLSERSDVNRPLQPLPVTSQDEIGELIGGFNRLLETLGRRGVALEQANERQLLATVAGGVGIWELDVGNNKLTWDNQMFLLYGVAPDNFGGAYETWKASVHPEDVERGNAEVQMALRGEKEFDTEFRVVWPSGTIRHIRARAHVHKDAAGQPTKLVGTNYDITELKRLELSLVDKDQHFKTLIATTPVGVFETDLDGKCIFVNERWLEISGLSFEAATGEGWASALHPEDRDKVTAKWLAAATEGCKFNLEYRFLRADGTITWVLGQSDKFLSATGEPLALLSHGDSS